MSQTPEIKYVNKPPLREADLEPLFAEAWGAGSARGYDAVLERSLDYIGAFSDRQLIGFVNLAWDGGAHSFILDTVVRSDFRRMGVGLELVRRAVAAARDAGVEWIHVDYEPHLDTFYGQAGLQPTSARLLHLERT